MSPRTDGAFSLAPNHGDSFAEVWPYETPALTGAAVPDAAEQTSWCPAATPSPVVDQVITAFSDIDDTMLVAGEHAARWLHGGARHGRGLTTWISARSYASALPLRTDPLTPHDDAPRLVVLPAPCTCTLDKRSSHNWAWEIRRTAQAISRVAYDGLVVTATSTPLNPPRDRAARKRTHHGNQQLAAVVRALTDRGYIAVRHIVAAPVGHRPDPTHTTGTQPQPATPQPTAPPPSTRESTPLVMVQLMAFAFRPATSTLPPWTPPPELPPQPGRHRSDDRHAGRRLRWSTAEASTTRTGPSTDYGVGLPPSRW